MNLFKVCLGQKSHCDIPDNAIRGILSDSIVEKQVLIKKNQAKEFVSLVGEKGYPICPSTFSGKGFNKDVLEQTQLFVLTFDYRSNFNKTHNLNLSYIDISAKADLYNLPIFFAYTMPSTFDLKPDDRVFCIVFRNEYPIYDYREAETLLKALLTIFPEANPTNSSVIDLYFGGNEVLYFDKSLPVINHDLVFMNLYCYLRIRYGENNFKRKIEKFAEETGVILNDGKPSVNFCSNGVDNFCLDGNSNDIDFLLYDLRAAIIKQRKSADTGRKNLKSVSQQVSGILRAEVRLTKPKAIRLYTEDSNVSGQIVEIVRNGQSIFFDTFARVVPFGDFHKKNAAMEIIRREVTDSIMRRRMLRLLTLIPEKKSLHLAQKAMNCRDVEKVIDAFAKINLSPVTISKRHDVKHLESIFSYL